MVDRAGMEVEVEVEVLVLAWECLACSRRGTMDGCVERIAAFPATRKM